ncbi:SseB family protein [Pengzhenrongella sicca]|uniref:SseB family protein n=1 Tax=Pengzhenrongella sicca TaxID=2819238 RepID=UPI001D0CC15D|nr:SseB family protein [Pengzhenrongella sicca]
MSGERAAGGHRRELAPSSPFADDDGAADPRLAAALAADTGGAADVVAALAAARVLVPVLAQVEPGEAASAGIVALRVRDGRSALPIFSSVATMARWRADARPVPTDVARAAASAIGEGWEVMVLDAGGPVTFVIGRPAVVALACGERWLPAVADGAVEPAVRAALAAALAGVPHVVRVGAEPGRRAEVAVLLAVKPRLDRPTLDAVIARANAALAADETVARRVDSLELRLVSAADAAAPAPGPATPRSPRPDRRGSRG